MTTETATRRTCSAIVSLAAGGWGFEDVICRQSRYVTTYITSGDVRVGWCRKPGHRANVEGRFAPQPDVPEPDWTLPGPSWTEWLQGMKDRGDFADHKATATFADEGLDPVTLAKGEHARWGL